MTPTLHKTQIELYGFSKKRSQNFTRPCKKGEDAYNILVGKCEGKRRLEDL